MSRTTIILLLLAVCGLASGCVPIPKKSVVRYGVQGSLEDSGTATPLAKSQVVVTFGTNIVRIEEKMTFRSVSPGHYRSNAKDFFLLETEVTNEMYERFLKSTGRTKGDTELADSERSRAESMRRSGRSTFSTASPVYDLSNPALLWTNNKSPRGTGNFPVALITRGDAEAFCEWLTSRYWQERFGRPRQDSRDQYGAKCPAPPCRAKMRSSLCRGFGERGFLDGAPSAFSPGGCQKS